MTATTTRESKCAALLVCALGAILLALTQTVARPEREDFEIRGSGLALQVASNNAAARRIAAERYRFMQRMESRFPGFYLYDAEMGHDTILFPLGRADRAYVLLLGGDSFHFYRVYCFERKDGKDRLVYRVDLEERDRLATKGTPFKGDAPVTSLLDYLLREQSGSSGTEEHIYGLVIKGAISRFAKSDLASRREYVEYDYHFGVGALYVSSQFGDHPGGGPLPEVYALGEDPFTRAKFRGFDEFYRKYGLPVMARELPLLKPGRPAPAPARPEAPSGWTLTTLHAFTGGADGGWPETGLVQGSGRSLYGTTLKGGSGSDGEGSLFKVTPSGSLTTFHSFGGAVHCGAPVGGLVEGSDGCLYGTTSQGGDPRVNGGRDCGTVFKLTPSGEMKVLHSFTGRADGEEPQSCLVAGSDGCLYGATSEGGGAHVNDRHSWGTVFKITPSGELTTLHVFTGGADGARPKGALLRGADGSFYGATEFGGDLRAYGGNGWGTVFRITPAGTLTMLHAFRGPDGGQPEAGLVQGRDGCLYGTTQYGGDLTSMGGLGHGTVYRITPSGALTTLHIFTGGPDGGEPQAALIQGSEGSLYGTTSSGGGGRPSGGGTVFKITPAGRLTTLHTFPERAVGGIAALAQGSDGNFYGTTRYGGHLAFQGGVGGGTVFKMTPYGKLTTLHAFTGPDGAQPEAGLFLGSDGCLYGTTSTAGGGIYTNGTVFKISPSGTLTTLYVFTGDRNADGGEPRAALVRGRDGNFYGTTAAGSPGDGTVFKVLPSGGFVTLHSFTGADGAEPEAGLVQGDDGSLYGTTAEGGRPGGDGAGTVFRIAPSGRLITLYAFTDGSEGGHPEGGLVRGRDGSLYGTTTGGYVRRNGTAFRLTPSGRLITLHAFTGGADGQLPTAGLVQGSDGSLYGATELGGDLRVNEGRGWGTVFRITRSGRLTTLHAFTGGADGGDPQADLILGSDGSLYGTTYWGGSGGRGWGTVYRITPSGSLTTLHSFNGADGGEPRAALLQGRDGALYGTTQYGGDLRLEDGLGEGTAFKLAHTTTPAR